MLRRPKVVVVLTVVGLGLLLVMLPSRLNDHLKRALGWLQLPFLGAANGLQETGHQARAYVTPRSVLLAEIDRLRSENRRMRTREFQFQELFRENTRLRSLVEWQSTAPWPLKLARVVGAEPSNWWRGIILNLGSEDGVAVNDPVLTEQGLVGKVISVSSQSARVALVGDPNCRVAAVLGDSGLGGIITPSGKGASNRRIVDLQHLPGEANLEPGTEIRTSGSGGVFPSGIPIGRLLDSQTYEFGLYSGARVRLRADLDRLNLVWVVVSRSDDSGEAQP